MKAKKKFRRTPAQRLSLLKATAPSRRFYHKSEFDLGTPELQLKRTLLMKSLKLNFIDPRFFSCSLSLLKAQKLIQKNHYYAGRYYSFLYRFFQTYAGSPKGKLSRTYQDSYPSEFFYQFTSFKDAEDETYKKFERDWWTSQALLKQLSPKLLSLFQRVVVENEIAYTLALTQERVENKNLLCLIRGLEVLKEQFITPHTKPHA